MRSKLDLIQPDVVEEVKNAEVWAEEGRQARRDGKNIQDNPYTSDSSTLTWTYTTESAAWGWWNFGYNDEASL